MFITIHCLSYIIDLVTVFLLHGGVDLECSWFTLFFFWFGQCTFLLPILVLYFWFLSCWLWDTVLCSGYRSRGVLKTSLLDTSLPCRGVQTMQYSYYFSTFDDGLRGNLCKGSAGSIKLAWFLYTRYKNRKCRAQCTLSLDPYMT